MGSSKKRTTKAPQNVNSGSVTTFKNKGSAQMQSDFISSNQGQNPAILNQQQISNYQLQQLQKQKNGSATQPIELAKIQTTNQGTMNASSFQNIIASQQNSGVISSKSKQSNSVTHAEKGNKNNFYIKQHLHQNRGKSYTSKDRSGVHQDGPIDPNHPSAHHRKNNSVVVQRGDILKFNAKQKQGTVLGVPSEMSPSRIERIEPKGGSSKGLKLPNASNQFGDQHHVSSVMANQKNHQILQEGRISSQSDYGKAMRYGSTGKIRVGKANSSSIEKMAKGGAMTPSI